MEIIYITFVVMVKAAATVFAGITAIKFSRSHQRAKTYGRRGH